MKLPLFVSEVHETLQGFIDKFGEPSLQAVTYCDGTMRMSVTAESSGLVHFRFIDMPESAILVYSESEFP